MILWGARTHFSVGESILQPDDLVDQAKATGYTHIALADVMTISGVIELAQSCKKKGVELITGCTLRVEAPGQSGVFVYPKVYVRSEDGFGLLLKLLSECQTSKFGRFVTLSQVIVMLASSEFWVTTGDAYGTLSSALSRAECERVTDSLRNAVGTLRCVSDVVAVPTPFFAAQNFHAMKYASDKGIGCALSGMPLYATAEDADARDAMASITKNQRVSSGARRAPYYRQHCIKPRAELVKEFGECFEIMRKVHPVSRALAAAAKTFNDTEARAERDLAWRWQKLPITLPKLADDEWTELCRLAVEGFKSRLSASVFGYTPDKSLLPEYSKRLKYELEVLKNMGFSGYFLLVADLVRWSKSVGIIVGPGRGSVGGSLVAFLTGITDVDPLRFNLLFERFINPERLDLPDADLDFASERRHEVIEYLIAKYGAENVAGISNYIGLEPPSALREVGKAFDLPIREYEVSKWMPKEHGKSVSLEDAIEREPQIAAYADKYPKQFEISKRLVGTMKTLGTHAAGIVVAGEPLVRRAVVETRGEFPVVNWDKRVVEDQGLVKIDILGLSNLDIIRKAFDYIEHATGRRIDILDIPLDDEKSLDAFTRGQTVGIFQFESGGMQRLLRDMGKGGRLTFDDLAACTALYRPGPLDSGMPEEYCAIKQGIKEPYYEHPAMEKCMGETFGVLIYQESVMALSRELCGFTMPEADALRKAIGKKDQEKLNAEAQKFIDGAVNHGGMELSRAEALWENIATFGSYGFNKSHSVEYSIISLVTMWLKIHHPLAFFAAALSVMKQERLGALCDDMKRFGIELLPPDVNHSDLDFKIDYANRALVIPLGRIKGISDNVASVILKERDVGGAFLTQMDFEKRIPKRSCNIRHKTILDNVGAFCSLDATKPGVRHPSRQRDQMDLLPGLYDQKIIVDREIVWGEFTKKQIMELVVVKSREMSGALPPVPRAGKRPQMMVIMDCPTWSDEKAGKAMESDNADFIKEAMEEAGLVWNRDGYFTFFVKVPKFGKRLSNEELEKWKPLLMQEIGIINPPIIVALGAETARLLCPDEKGGTTELAGKVVYHKALDANVVIGISPGSVWLDGSKQALMNRAFSEAAQLIRV